MCPPGKPEIVRLRIEPRKGLERLSRYIYAAVIRFGLIATDQFNAGAGHSPKCAVSGQNGTSRRLQRYANRDQQGMREERLAAVSPSGYLCRIIPPAVIIGATWEVLFFQSGPDDVVGRCRLGHTCIHTDHRCTGQAADGVQRCLSTWCRTVQLPQSIRSAPAEYGRRAIAQLYAHS
jgi:hypothetical protein